MPQAERNHKFLKERIRVTYQLLPFKALPKTLVKQMVVEGVKRLNYFPQTGGILGYSPRTMLGEQALDYTKHCLYSFGTYCMGPHEANP